MLNSDYDESDEFGEDDDSIIDPFDLHHNPSSYSSFSFQEKLLQDPLFQGLCNTVIRPNEHLFRDKVVLEVDCGLGLVSMMVSKFAKKVIAVDSSRLADLLTDSIALNKIENIVVIKGDIDEIESLPEKADILISQYLGFLVYDKRLLTRFLKARDKFLKPRGILMPDCIRLFISGIEYERKTWEKLKLLKLEGIFAEPIEEIIPKSQVVTDDHMIRNMNLRTVSIDNFNHTHQFYLILCRRCLLNAYILHFEIGFTSCHKYVFLKNSPFEPGIPSTLWKQLVLLRHLPRSSDACMTCTGEFAIKAIEREGEFVTQFQIDDFRYLTWKEQDKLYRPEKCNKEKRYAGGPKRKMKKKKNKK